MNSIIGNEFGTNQLIGQSTVKKQLKSVQKAITLSSVFESNVILKPPLILLSPIHTVTKVPFIYYVSTIWGYLHPLPPLCPLRKHVFSTEDNQKLPLRFVTEVVM